MNGSPLNGLTPRRLFRALATAEAITWALLLVGMLLKHVTETTDLAVGVFGPVHGVVFIAYGLGALVVAIDQRWSPGRLVLGLAAAVPPFATLPFERYADRRGALGDAWLSRPDSPTAPQRAVCWLLEHRRRAIVIGAGAVLGLTGVALLVGPPG